MDGLDFSFEKFEELPDLETRLRKNRANCGSTAARKPKKFFEISRASGERLSKAHPEEAVIISSDEEEQSQNDQIDKENEDEITVISETSNFHMCLSPKRKGPEAVHNLQEKNEDPSEALHRDSLSADGHTGVEPRNCVLAPIFVEQKQVSSASQAANLVSHPPLSKAEAKKRAVQERKIERERLKKQKLEEKEKLKQQKILEKTAKKANSISECTKWLQVRVGEALLEEPSMRELPAAVGAAGLLWDLEAEPVLWEAITFYRVCPVSRQATKEDVAIVVPHTEDFVKLVLGGLEEQCRVWKEVLCVSSLTIFLWQLDDCIRNLKKRRRKNEAIPNRLDCETALALAQLQQRVNHRIFNDAADLAEYTVCIARAVAQAPYKKEILADHAAFAWYAESSNVCPVKVSAEGVGLLKLWQQQLRQFTSVGLETAQAIARAYPAPALLLEAYDQLTPEEGKLLLENIPVVRGCGALQTSRRVGKELSRKIYTFFTSLDPDQILGT